MAASDYLTHIRSTLACFRNARASDADILFIDAVWDHHARHSGYSPLCRGIGFVPVPKLQVLPNFAGRALSALSLNPYWERQVLLRALLRVGGFRHLHINDGDFIRWPVAPKPRGVTVSATFHHPLDRLTRNVPEWREGELDLAIAVARCQVPYLESVFGAGRAVFVAHGVDTGYFQPGGGDRDPDLVISVGVHRRDFKTLAAAATIIRSRRPQTRVGLIAPQRHVPDFIGDAPIELFCDVPDEELLRLYQTAAAQLLPLAASTANNAVLEGMAAGLPLVTTELDGVADYVHPDWCVSCPPGDAEAHAEAALALLDAPDRRQAMETAARTHATNYDWRVIRETFRETLRHAAAGEP